MNNIFIINEGKKELSIWNLILDENFYDDEPFHTIEFLSKYNNSALR